MERAEALVDEVWRMGPAGFAEHVSHASDAIENWEPYPYLRYVSNRIRNAVVTGGRVIINAPPRHCKSTLTSLWLPAWFLDTWPEKRVILASYEANIAKDWGYRVRDVFKNSTETTTQIREDKKKVNDWMTHRGGGMKTAGVGGPITGGGADLLILDDPYKNAAQAESPAYRRYLQNWWSTTFLTRAEPGAAIILNMARWLEEDICGWLMDGSPE